MIDMNIEVEGLSELHSRLKSLDPKKRVAEIRKAARKAMKPVVNSMKEGASEDTGDLKSSIAMRARTGSRSDSNRLLTISAGPIKKAVKADGEKHKLTGVNQKAIAQEYGNAKQTAKPFIRPALDNNKNTVLDILKDELKKQLDRLGNA